MPKGYKKEFTQEELKKLTAMVSKHNLSHVAWHLGMSEPTLLRLREGNKELDNAIQKGLKNRPKGYKTNREKSQRPIKQDLNRAVDYIKQDGCALKNYYELQKQRKLLELQKRVRNRDEFDNMIGM